MANLETRIAALERVAKPVPVLLLTLPRETIEEAKRRTGITHPRVVIPAKEWPHAEP